MVPKRTNEEGLPSYFPSVDALRFNRQDRSSPRAYKAANYNAWFYSAKTTAYEDSQLKAIDKTASNYVHCKNFLQYVVMAPKS